MTVFTLVALLYLTMSLPLTYLAHRLEHKFGAQVIVRTTTSQSRSARTACSTTSASRSRQGEVVCIIGASGSGKSTLLRCMNGLESYDSGELAIDDAA